LQGKVTFSVIMSGDISQQ